METCTFVEKFEINFLSIFVSSLLPIFFTNITIIGIIWDHRLRDSSKKIRRCIYCKFRMKSSLQQSDDINFVSVRTWFTVKKKKKKEEARLKTRRLLEASLIVTSVCGHVSTRCTMHIQRVTAIMQMRACFLNFTGSIPENVWRVPVFRQIE